MGDGMALPEDVLIEILVNLPVKSLMRFRCVSKYWCDLIKSPNFVSRHLRRDCDEIVLLKRLTNGRRRTVLSFHDPDSLDLLVSPNPSIPPSLDHLGGYGVFHDYMGSCNGLVCLALMEKVILCNPALQEFELLPPSPFVCPEGYYAESIVAGFGYDAVTDTYKVVQFWEIADRKVYTKVLKDVWTRVDLYNSCTNSWRPIDAVTPRVMDYPEFYLFFNGACHWHSHDYDCSHGIISFDLSTETFQQFEYPNYEDDAKSSSLVVLNQCLSVVRFGQFVAVDIWVMKEYGVKESWTKEFVIGPYSISCPLLFLKNGWLLVETLENQLASCAVHGNETKRFHFHGVEDSMQTVMYRESLVSVKQVIHGKPQ